MTTKTLPDFYLSKTDKNKNTAMPPYPLIQYPWFTVAWKKVEKLKK